MARMRKRVAEFVGFQVASWIAHVFYFAGLTALIPLMPLVLSPERFVQARYAFGVAVGSIVLGFVLIFWFSKSRRNAFRSMGMFTLIPGLLAVAFAFMGPRRISEFLGMFGKVTPLLKQWIDSYVPKAWLLAGIYIILGVILVWLGEKAKK
ncbi:MAG: hypothetical protein QW165_01945 [Candidatus Woesearchaeota archaeon]